MRLPISGKKLLRYRQVYLLWDPWPLNALAYGIYIFEKV